MAIIKCFNVCINSSVLLNQSSYLMSFFFVDATKPEKLSDLSSNFREMQEQISQLNADLDNARQELKELKEKGDSRIEDLRRELQEIKNFTQERKAVSK